MGDKASEKPTRKRRGIANLEVESQRPLVLGEDGFDSYSKPANVTRGFPMSDTCAEDTPLFGREVALASGELSQAFSRSMDILLNQGAPNAELVDNQNGAIAEFDGFGGTNRRAPVGRTAVPVQYDGLGGFDGFGGYGDEGVWQSGSASSLGHHQASAVYSNVPLAPVQFSGSDTLPLSIQQDSGTLGAEAQRETEMELVTVTSRGITVKPIKVPNPAYLSQQQLPQ